MQVNEKFPVLSTVAKIVNAVGWGTVIIGAVYLIGAIIGIITNSGEPQELEEQVLLAARYVRIIATSGAIVGGFITVAFAEVIGVFFAIEKNTREPVDFSPLKEDLIKLMKSETDNFNQGNVTSSKLKSKPPERNKSAEKIELTPDELVKKEELVNTLAENEVVVINKRSRLIMKMSKFNVNNNLWQVIYPVEV